MVEHSVHMTEVGLVRGTLIRTIPEFDARSVRPFFKGRNGDTRGLRVYMTAVHTRRTRSYREAGTCSTSRSLYYSIPVRDLQKIVMNIEKIAMQ